MTHARADWASLLNGVLLAYRVTPQQATGFSSFELLYAHAPVLVGEQLSGEDLDPLPDSDIQRVPSNSGAVGRAATRLAERAEVLRSHRAVAMHNQKVAQTRDQEQYRRRRDGHYVLPRRGSGIRMVARLRHVDGDEARACGWWRGSGMRMAAMLGHADGGEARACSWLW